MKNSDFQFNNPRLTNFEFNFNRDADFDKSKDFTLETNFDININNIKGKNKSIVELSILVTEKNGFFTIKAEIGSSFSWNDSVDSTVLDVLLKQNAPALLVSYLRPIIVNITNYSPIGAIDLPFIDFTEDE
ncbi:protein-export chaperone SecB [Aminipila terrae]|uniref:Preprotein translocase subunit SecB n=1 Tax=Aminipila terrae TaxID=2697030 RepID=A0A6P1MKX8_9FIRM|nr:protein-export chaperone SecB [Aminipila terrae]QHI73813.1 hypothetical protein Ami3637_16750 [Aminipila terrae]